MSEPAVFSLAGKRIWIAGHRGMVGRALHRRLAREDATLLVAGRETLDLRRQADVYRWLEQQRPDLIFLAAARVGGIAINAARPADFLFDNLMIEANVIEGARRCGAAKVVFLGSSCIYPKLAPQPISEEALLDGALEPTNEWYAVAKIAGIKLCQAYRRQHGCDFISAQPTNLYGIADNFDLNTSHVLPALIRKAHEAKIGRTARFEVWGSGSPLREFLFVDDLADALVFLAERYSDERPINIGSGQEITIRDLALRVAEAVGYAGQIVFDPSHPDGTPRKLLDSGRLEALGWRASTALADGLAATYRWYLEHVDRDGAVRTTVAA